MSMKFQAVKGMRDFYPEDMAVLNWILAGWRRVSVRHGFQEFDSPLLEYLDLYTVKSGEGIVSELFHLTDRGGRDLAIRPEVTPTLARMVAARANALPRPIKWFTMPRLCRAEKPQRGRGREFFQWNIDNIGVDDAIADAECVFVAADYLRQAGLTAGDAVVRIADRRLHKAILAGFGIPDDQHEKALGLLDKAEKVEADKMRDMWNEAFGSQLPFDSLQRLLAAGTLDEFSATAPQVGLKPDSFEGPLAGLRQLWTHLTSFGIADWCRFDLHIVRGLAYYTGMVFEIHDKRGELRALAGGGRYDNLLQLVGGPQVPAVGFGMGDIVLSELLKDLGRLQGISTSVDMYLIDADEGLFPDVLKIAADLRRAGIAAEFSYKRQNLGKQLKSASARGARLVVIVGQKYREQRMVEIKDMQTGSQREAAIADLLAKPQDHITVPG
jgi:histidyl-tRNA synthetase